MATWKRDFASGLIVLVPLLVTAVVLLWIYNRLAQVPLPVQNEPVRVLLTIVIFVLLVFSAGYLMRTAFGAVVERAIDDLMNRLPGLRVVYNASKMGVETALSGTEDFRQPVKLEVMGLRMTGFKTGKETDDGRDVIFLPTAPNITTGYVIELEPDRYEETEESVEDALTRLLSAGFGERREDPIDDIFEETPEDGDGNDTEQSGDEPATSDPDEGE